MSAWGFLKHSFNYSALDIFPFPSSFPPSVPLIWNDVLPALQILRSPLPSELPECPQAEHVLSENQSIFPELSYGLCSCSFDSVCPERLSMSLGKSLMMGLRSLQSFLVKMLIFSCMKVKVAQLCLTLCDPMDYSLPGSSVHGILQQEYWSGFPFPSPGDLPDPWIEPTSPALHADSLPS